MPVVPLSQASDREVVGGKAAALGELIRLGEHVPPGFCVPAGEAVPPAEILQAYAELGGPVAVRSSATAEDLPGASFAGQYDSVLDVTGGEALLAAIERCRASLHGPRATAYREAHGIPHAGVRMAVVVQRMVEARNAGVLFTANPLTGRRAEMLVESAPGSGAAVVDGSVPVDRGEPDPELRAIGERLEKHFGSPQDVEWVIDPHGTRWLLQSRPITTLFPLPPPSAGPRVYVEFGHVQGMLRPVTPMGLATLRRTVAAMAASLGLRADIVDIGSRLYGDLTDLARHPVARKRLVKMLAVDFGPRAQAAMEIVLDDPRFAPSRERRARRGGGGPGLGTAGRALSGVTRALARPDRARGRLFDAVERLRVSSAAPGDLRTVEDRLRFVRAGSAPGADGVADDITWPIVAGMLAATLPAHLLGDVARPGEIQAILGGVPHNVTIEMDLALWHLAERAGDHRDLLLTTPPAELAARYLRGELPDVGLGTFLDAYGHRGPAEADLGVPRWAEDPAPLFAAIANYLRLDDPEQAPDRRFARAAATAATTLDDLAARARRRRPLRGRLAVFLLRRARRLAGLREAGKFAGLYHLRAVREQLLLIGADLSGTGKLAEPGDIMFLTLDEVDRDVDHRAIVAERRAVHRFESRRRSVPVVLLSDGTDVERTRPAPADGLRGVGAAPGRATGPARVVHDPATAHVEPGEILVAATTDPGWTPLFLTAAALVTETGAIMAHGPTVAREYGLPAVISVPGATERIRTGQIVTVDGTAGTVL